MIPDEWILQAAERIAPHIRRTPVTHDPGLDVTFKWENRQVTGSFKARGALNKVLSLQDWERSPGLVAASAGNHGQGVALAGKITGAQVVIFLPSNAAKIKVDAIKKIGAEIKMVAGGYEAAEAAAFEYARGHSMAWISPYNDIQVICGQGTIGLELCEQVDLSRIRQVVVPVGGGGLISGVGQSLRGKYPSIKLIGVQSEASAYFYAIKKTGTQEHVVEFDSLADGLEGRVEENAITIPIVKSMVDDILLVTESEIRMAIQYAWQKYGEVIEGSAAVVLAARLSGKLKALPAVMIISGGNINPELHRQISGNHAQ